MTVAAALVAAPGALVCQEKLKMIAFNISNANTTAYREKFLESATVVASTGGGVNAGVAANEAGNVEASNITNGLGVKIQGENTNMQQGSLKVTENTYDLAIDGKGYFVVTSADGKKFYTRAGNFKKDATGQIVTQKGYVVSPGITIPANAVDVTINESGEVWVTPDGEDPQNVGQIEIATFSNPGGLREVGDNLLEQADPNDAPVTGVPNTEGRGSIVQKALEESNVEVVKQLVESMQVNNTFALLMKIIEADKKQGEQVASAA